MNSAASPPTLAICHSNTNSAPTAPIPTVNAPLSFPTGLFNPGGFGQSVQSISPLLAQEEPPYMI